MECLVNRNSFFTSEIISRSIIRHWSLECLIKFTNFIQLNLFTKTFSTSLFSSICLAIELKI